MVITRADEFLRFPTVSAHRIHSRHYRKAEFAEANGATRAPGTIATEALQQVPRSWDNIGPSVRVQRDLLHMFRVTAAEAIEINNQFSDSASQAMLVVRWMPSGRVR
jgi:hypothetical protein